MTQPIHDILRAPDAGYPSGAGAKTGTENKIRPDDSEQALAIVPGKRIGAQQQNYCDNQTDRALESVLDLAALNYSPVFEPSAQFNTALVRSDTKLIGARLILGADPIPRALICWTDTAEGLLAYSRADSDTDWFDAANPTLTISSNAVAGDAGNPQIIIWDPAAGTVKKSSDASAWSAAGTVATGAGVDGYSMGIYFSAGSRWFLARRSHVTYSDDLSSWTEVDLNGIGWTGAPPESQLCMAQGSGGVIIGLPSHVVYSAEGSAWELQSIPAGMISIDYSESRQEWCGVTGTGAVYTAPGNATPWTLKSSIGAGDAHAIKAMGRSYVAACQYGLMVAQKAAGPWTRVLSPSAGGANGFTDLCFSRDCLVVGERDSIGGRATFRMVRGMRAPWLAF